jgi:hypothetical protein
MKWVQKRSSSIPIKVLLLLYFLYTSTSIFSQEYSQLHFSEKNAHEIIELLEESFQIDFNYDYDIFTQKDVDAFSVNGSKQQILETAFNVLNKDFTLLEDKLYVIKDKEYPLEKKISPTQYKIKLIDDLRTNLSFGVISLDNLNKQFVTDVEGKFILSGYFSSEQLLVLEYLGYKKKRVKIGSLRANKTNIIVLKEEEHLLDEIVIKERFIHFDDTELEGSVVVNESLEVGGNLDNDVMTNLQRLSGISSSTESISDLQIRGSQPGLTTMTWNNIQLLQSSLFFGNVSSVNPFMTDVIRVNKNGGSAHDSGDSSSSVDLESDHFGPSRSQLKVYADMLYFNVGVTTSLLKNKLKVKAAYRQSLSEIVETPYYRNLYENVFQDGPVAISILEDRLVREAFPDDVDLQNSPFPYIPEFKFKDLSASFLYKPSAKATIEFNVLDVGKDFKYFSEDVNINRVDFIEVSNTGYSVKAQYQITPFWKSEVVASTSIYERLYERLENASIGKIGGYIEHDNLLTQSSIEVNQLFKYNNHEWTAGVSYQNIDATTFLVNAGPNNDVFGESILQTIGNEKSIYLDYTITIPNVLKFRNGTRWSDFNLTYDGRVFIEPRIHLSLFPIKNFVLHAHYGTYHRFLNRQFNYSALEVEESFWYASDESIFTENRWLPVVDESQYSAGVKYTFDKYHAGIELYRKNINNVSTESFDFDSGENPYTIINSKVKGLEFDFGYTGNNLVLSGSFDIMDNILEIQNDDVQFRDPYFQPFKATFNGSYRFKQLLVSAQYRYAAGRYFTEPSEIIPIYNEDGARLDYIDFKFGELTEEQLPSYKRLDLSIKYQLPKNKFSDVQLGLSVLNALGTENITHSAFDIYWWTDPIEARRFDKFGLKRSVNASILISI